MTKQAHKISKKWIEQKRLLFREFLDETDFPDPERLGERGPKFQYPEWLIMFIAILSVKLKVKTYVQIHRMGHAVLGPNSRRLRSKAYQRAATARSLKKNLPSPSKASNVYLSVIS